MCLQPCRFGSVESNSISSSRRTGACISAVHSLIEPLPEEIGSENSPKLIYPLKKCQEIYMTNERLQWELMQTSSTSHPCDPLLLFKEAQEQPQLVGGGPNWGLKAAGTEQRCKVSTALLAGWELAVCYTWKGSIRGGAEWGAAKPGATGLGPHTMTWGTVSRRRLRGFGLWSWGAGAAACCALIELLLLQGDCYFIGLFLAVRPS